MAHAPSVYCARCTHDVAPVLVWPGARYVKRVYYGALLLLAPFTPVLLSDAFVLMPLLTVVALAAGPVHMLDAERSTCSECGAELTLEPRRGRFAR